MLHLFLAIGKEEIGIVRVQANLVTLSGTLGAHVDSTFAEHHLTSTVSAVVTDAELCAGDADTKTMGVDRERTLTVMMHLEVSLTCYPHRSGVSLEGFRIRG